MNPKDAKKILQNIKFSVSRNDWLRSNGENRVMTPITLSIDDIMNCYERQAGACYWSGISLDPKYNYLKRHPLAISTERFDNAVGYSYDNIRLVLRLFNLGRCSYQGDFHEIVKILKQNINVDVIVNRDII